MNFRDNFWEEAEEQMRARLWAEGHSCSVIAAMINAVHRNGRSRNSIIGKARRMDMTARRSPIVSDPNKPRKIKRSDDMRRLLTHPNEDLLRWDIDDE
jgi:hypothetical protein